MLCQDSSTAQALLDGEPNLLQLVSDGTPLPQALDKICVAVDRQVSNVVSLVLFPDGKEHTLRAIGEAVAQFGLFVFSCAAILSPDGELWATLETYSCIPRSPTPEEAALVERAAYLAALAFLNCNHKLDFGSFALPPNDALGGYSPDERTPGD
jgi:hypothetical protein